MFQFAKIQIFFRIFANYFKADGGRGKPAHRPVN